MDKVHGTNQQNNSIHKKDSVRKEYLSPETSVTTDPSSQPRYISPSPLFTQDSHKDSHKDSYKAISSYSLTVSTDSTYSTIKEEDFATSLNTKATAKPPFYNNLSI